MPNLETVLAEQFNALRQSLKNNPLNLGGFTASGGGLGGPPGGYIGMLPQTRVAYDMNEEATPISYVPSGASLLDNLNHIRYRMNMISGGGTPDLQILQSGVVVVSGFKYLNFEGDATLEPFPDGVTVTMTSIPGPQGETGVGVTDVSVSLSGVVIATGIADINFEGNVQVVTTANGVTVTMSGGGGTSDLTLPIYEDVGINTIPNGALHVMSSGNAEVTEIIQARGSELNNLWLVSDDSSYTLKYTTDFINFTNTDVPSSIYADSKGARSNGTMWLMPTNDNQTLYYSLDGIHWTATPETPFPSGTIEAVAWNGSMWVAVGDAYSATLGDYYATAYSTDGLHWTPNLVNYLGGYGHDIAWNGSVWVACGSPQNDTAVIIYSSNGKDWSVAADNTFMTEVNTISWNGSIWVAGGNGTHTLAYSSNGIAWTGNGTSTFNYECLKIISDGTIFMAVGSTFNGTPTSPIAKSTNGVDWTNIDIFRLDTRAGFRNTAYSVGWNGTYWLIGGKDWSSYADMKMNAYSTDTTNWTFIFDYSVTGDDYMFFDSIGCFPAPGYVPQILGVTQTAKLTEWRAGPSIVGSVDVSGNAKFTSLSINPITAGYVMNTASGLLVGGNQLDISPSLTVLEDSVSKKTEVAAINFTGNVDVTATASGVTVNIPTQSGVSGGDMYKSTYDTNNNGIVDAADKATMVSGIDSAGNSKYYGTNSVGTPGFYALPTSSGGGSGDMLKSVYDTDDDGIVDLSESSVTISGASTAGNSKYFGTNAAGSVGFYSLPTASGAGSGDVVGPSSAVDGHLVVFDSTTGKLVKDGGAVPTGGGGVPQVVQVVMGTPSVTSMTLPYTPTEGNVLILYTNSTTGQVSNVACTNVTWTQLATFTGSSGYYALWVGLVGASAGTAVTMSKPGAYNTTAIIEVDASLTPTLATSVFSANAALKNLTGLTAGDLMVLASSCDSTAQLVTLYPSAPSAGLFTGVIGLVVCYATGSNLYLNQSYGGAGGSIIAKLT